MSFPGVIKRPLFANEFSIYLDNTVPIPLSALATFLGKIDKAARSVRGMDGFLLELSDFALGSNELRFRIVGKNRPKSDDEARQERMAIAGELSAKYGAISAGAAVVSAVAAVVAIAIASGNANPATYRITKQYNVNTVYVQAPEEDTHIITSHDIEYGRSSKESFARVKHAPKLRAESEALVRAMDDHHVVKLAGRFFRDEDGGYIFETMIGNRFPVHFKNARDYEHNPVALEVIVQDSAHGPHLDVVEVIAELSDY